ncbi:serine/threonine-protein kinase [Streptomyces sp. NRRL F-5126]|uniref:serine/threonine-protein kinase n=1 Tax=Streptomyces sp. NRRL F-5126 TaxID=1463857 RepID=UPI000AB5ECD9|nr:serine/threonine-protein kinase [Streptomyces sp. NRRL F-5126]
MEKLSAQDPRSVGAYRLLARLGSGGLGRVYLARSEGGSTVAVRVVRRELAGQAAFRASLREVVAAARRVTGAWTVPVLDADTEAEVPWVVCDYVAAPTLLSLVSLVPGGGTGHGPLPARSVHVLASGLAHALADIHGAGLVHRDFKPSNVLITEHGPLVRDFGITRALDAATDGGLRLTGTLIGAPGFMSPEQVRGEAETPASDVFSLGSVLTYAATGRLPFGGTDSSAHALQLRITQEEPDTSGLPEGLGRLVRDCLHKDPERRPSARAVLDRVGGPETAGESWLPADVLAELGQHTARLSGAVKPRPAQPLPPQRPAQQQETQQQESQQQQPYIYPLQHHNYHQPLPQAQQPQPPASGFPPPLQPPSSFADAYADAPAHHLAHDDAEPPARSKRATIAPICPRPRTSRQRPRPRPLRRRPRPLRRPTATCHSASWAPGTVACGPRTATARGGW